jgi:hypothetical protein
MIDCFRSGRNNVISIAVKVDGQLQRNEFLRRRASGDFKSLHAEAHLRKQPYADTGSFVQILHSSAGFLNSLAVGPAVKQDIERTETLVHERASTSRFTSWLVYAEKPLVCMIYQEYTLMVMRLYCAPRSETARSSSVR